MTRTVTVLGSTGSIGTQTLEVIREHPDLFSVAGLAAGSSTDLIVQQARQFGARSVAVADEDAARIVRDELGAGVEVLAGIQAATELAGAGADVVVNGIVGSRGLGPTLAALRAGSRLALANKESLILGGRLVLDAAAPGQLVPVDSEHSALAQCLRAGQHSEVARLIVTASGGPFRGRSRDDLGAVTVADALAHPTWDMGAVITVSSATLANKGFEVIEASLLFGIDYDRIEVVVHPQSIIHGLVEFCDGAVVAKLSPPDMRLPIQLALSWPDRLDSAPARFDWAQLLSLDFEPLDRATFPMVDLAFEAGRLGGSAPGVLNAANEEAVAAFLDGRLGFLGIAAVAAAVLSAHDSVANPDLDALMAAEAWARAVARERIAAAGSARVLSPGAGTSAGMS